MLPRCATHRPQPQCRPWWSPWCLWLSSWCLSSWSTSRSFSSSRSSSCSWTCSTPSTLSWMCSMCPLTLSSPGAHRRRSCFHFARENLARCSLRKQVSFSLRLSRPQSPRISLTLYRMLSPRSMRPTGRRMCAWSVGLWHQPRSPLLRRSRIHNSRFWWVPSRLRPSCSIDWPAHHKTTPRSRIWTTPSPPHDVHPCRHRPTSS